MRCLLNNGKKTTDKENIMGNSVGESMWDNHPVVKADAKKATKGNAQALKAAGAKGAKPTKPLTDSGGHVNINIKQNKNNMENAIRANQPGALKRPDTSASRPVDSPKRISNKPVVKIRTSGLQGRGGSLGGIHMGGSGMNWETK